MANFLRSVDALCRVTRPENAAELFWIQSSPTAPVCQKISALSTDMHRCLLRAQAESQSLQSAINQKRINVDIAYTARDVGSLIHTVFGDKVFEAVRSDFFKRMASFEVDRRWENDQQILQMQLELNSDLLECADFAIWQKSERYFQELKDLLEWYIRVRKTANLAGMLAGDDRLSEYRTTLEGSWTFIQSSHIAASNNHTEYATAASSHA